MKILTFILIMTFTRTLFASGLAHDRFDPFEGPKGIRQPQKVEEKKLTPEEFTGRVRCANESHSKNGNCDLELVTKSGVVIGIDENKILGGRHCEKHKDLMVKLIAMKHPKFLFWGGGLDVKSFNVLKEVLPVKVKRSRRNRFEHLHKFNI